MCAGHMMISFFDYCSVSQGVTGNLTAEMADSAKSHLKRRDVLSVGEGVSWKEKEKMNF